jgi:hypothetical protein
MSLDDIEMSLPRGWVVYDTIEGNRLFTHFDGLDPVDKETYSSWSHPDPAFEQQNYDAVHSPRPHPPDERYEALSYVWGDVRNNVDITVMGSTPSEECSLLGVGSNLYDALVHLRRPCTPRDFWVDAISINQEDPDERSSQVQRMHSIYKYASRVVAWLGTASQSSELALRTLENIGQQIECTSDNLMVPTPNAKEKDRWYSPPQLAHGTREAILQLAERPYFRRLWIIQEVQTANQDAIFQCGELNVRWYWLRRGLTRIELSTPYQVDSLADDLMSTSLEHLLCLAMESECTEPRDRIYAMLGLFPRLMRTSIKPQYSLPVADVYTQAILAIMETTRRLNPLLGQYIEDTYNPNSMPSWSLALVDTDERRT